MPRYDWPNDLRKAPGALAGRAAVNLARRSQPASAGSLGDLEALGEVIEAGFDVERRWTPIGPTVLRKGQASGAPVVSGRVRDLQVHPEGLRAYIAAANGGIWYTGNFGADWIPIGSWALVAQALRGDLVLTIGALLVDWGLEDDGVTDSPERDVVYVGTGEIQPYFAHYPGGSHAGIGVLRLFDTIGGIATNPGTNPWRREAANLTGTGIYRLAREPGVPLAREEGGPNTIVAATSQGLYTRTGPFVDDASWSFVDFADGAFDENDGRACTDVLWSEQGLFVTLMGGGEDHDGVWHSATGPTGTFTRIALPDHDIGSRLSLAPSPTESRRIYVVGKRTPPRYGYKGPAHGWMIDLSHTPAGVGDTPIEAFGIGDWPVSLYTATVTLDGSDFLIEGDQSHYDQSVTVVDDGGADVLFVGGSGSHPHSWVFRLPITGTAAADDLSASFAKANQTKPAKDPTYAGSGIHADVHALRAAETDLWVGCDGGVFTRPTTSSVDNALSLNAGLPTTEPGYVSSHPFHDGDLIAGLQDNGFIRRVGGAVWDIVAGGDGGGCVYHPTRPELLLKQSTNASWDFIPARLPRGPALRRANTDLWASETKENGRSSFYSAPLALPGASDELARVFVGTYRLWMSGDWGPDGKMNWVTIPSATDPHPTSGAPVAGAADTHDVKQDRLRTAGRRDPIRVIEALVPGEAPDFDGTRLLLLCESSIRVFALEVPDGGGAPSWTRIKDSVVSGKRPKDKKADGDEPDPFLDYLPRFEGTAWTDVARQSDRAFYVSTTGRTQRANDGTLTADPNYDTLWWFDGSDRWYPTGLRTTAPDVATGAGGTPASAHSVLVDPDNPDIVWVGTRIGVFEGRIDLSGEHPVWTWRPIMDGLPQTLVEDLSLFRAGERRYLRAALISLGVWERDVSETPHSVGRSFVRSASFDTGRVELPGPLVDPALADQIDKSPDIVYRLTPPFPPPWLPDEAWFASAVTSTTANSQGGYNVWVQVHHRDTEALAANQLQVNLFLLSYELHLDADALELDPPTRNAIVNAVGGDGTPRDLPLINLRYLGRESPIDPLSSRRSRAVHFDVDMTRLSPPLFSTDRVAVIAVINPANRPFEASHIDPPPGESDVTLGQVLRRSPYLAARTFRRL